MVEDSLTDFEVQEESTKALDDEYKIHLNQFVDGVPNAKHLQKQMPIRDTQRSGQKNSANRYLMRFTSVLMS